MYFYLLLLFYIDCDYIISADFKLFVEIENVFRGYHFFL